MKNKESDWNNSQQKIEAISAVCLLIASKVEEIYPLRLDKDILYAVQATNTIEQLQETEREVLRVIYFYFKLCLIGFGMESDV